MEHCVYVMHRVKATAPVRHMCAEQDWAPYGFSEPISMPGSAGASCTHVHCKCCHAEMQCCTFYSTSYEASLVPSAFDSVTGTQAIVQYAARLLRLPCTPIHREVIESFSQDGDVFVQRPVQVYVCSPV